jgi:hypothetical protein
MHCIALSPEKRAPHWAVYRRMIGVLQNHNVGEVESIVSELEVVSGVRESK